MTDIEVQKFDLIALHRWNLRFDYIAILKQVDFGGSIPVPGFALTVDKLVYCLEWYLSNWRHDFPSGGRGRMIGGTSERVIEKAVFSPVVIELTQEFTTIADPNPAQRYWYH